MFVNRNRMFALAAALSVAVAAAGCGSKASSAQSNPKGSATVSAALNLATGVDHVSLTISGPENRAAQPLTKVDSTHSPRGPLGQTYLATGVGVGMRLWRDRPPGEAQPEVARDYETVGYVISARAELHSEGQMVLLEPGNCWVVPRHAVHTYKILEPFTAIEATHPPAEIHDRDHPAG